MDERISYEIAQLTCAAHHNRMDYRHVVIKRRGIMYVYDGLKNHLPNSYPQPTIDGKLNIQIAKERERVQSRIWKKHL